MNNNLALSLVGIAVLLGLQGCSFVRDWFPDKEKDYQYTSEIPPLIYPKDLATAGALRLPAGQPALPATVVAVPEPPAADIAEPAQSQAVAEVPEFHSETATANPLSQALPADESPRPRQAEVKRAPLVANLIDGGQTALLRLDTDFDNAWRAVNKALSRKSIEVTARNQAEKQISIRYDSSQKPAEDSGYWDEVLFIFKGLSTGDKPYVLQFGEYGQQTDVSVLDEGRKPAGHAESISLLTLLQDTIKTDFAK